MVVNFFLYPDYSAAWGQFFVSLFYYKIFSTSGSNSSLCLVLFNSVDSTLSGGVYFLSFSVSIFHLLNFLLPIKKDMGWDDPISLFFLKQQSHKSLNRLSFSLY